MIVYHLCHTPDVPRQLAEGLSRSHSCHYVFQRWDDIQILLLRLDPESSPQAQSTDYAVLVLDVDEDMLLPGPIPQSKIPARLRAQDLQGLQARSYFLEVDLSPKRIQDVKDGLGNSILARYHQQDQGRAPIWRFLA